MLVTTIRFFHELLSTEVRRAHRETHSLSLLAVDVEAMRELNTRLGREGGDRVIAAIEAALVLERRQGEALVRYAGDERLLLLPRTGPGEVHARARAVRQRLATVALPFAGSLVRPRCHLAVASLGPGQGPSDLLDSLAEGLRQARQTLAA